MADHQDIVLIHLEYIKAGIDELKAGQAAQGSELREHGEAIAVLQDRATEARSAAVKWGAGVGAAVAALLAGLSQWLGGK